MNKRLFIGGLLIAITLLIVNSVYALTAVNTDPSATDPGNTTSGSFSLTNNDGAAVTGISFAVTSLVGLTDNTKNIPNTVVSFNPSSVSSLANTAATTIATSVAVPTNLAAQTYQGTLNVSGTVSGASTSTTFTLSVVVNSLTTLDVPTYDAANALKISGQEGNTKTGTFTITNTGNVALSSPTFSHNIGLNDSDGDSITLSFSNPGTINPSASATVTATAVFGDNIDLDSYSGTVTVTSGSATDTFKLTLSVQPEICEDGIVKDGVSTGSSTANLDIDVTEPDNGDNIKPGDVINLEVKVKNDNDDEMDVVVEAILYNLDENDEIAKIESDSVNLEDGESETFDLELEVPESSDLDVGDTYVLYVKAFQDGDEDENCNEESVNLDFERDAHQTVVKKINVTPSISSCSQNIDISVEVENQGTRDEDDVYIRLRNSELGLDMESNRFDLDKYSGNDESATKRFNFVIPSNAQLKDYLVEAIVYFDDDGETHSDFETLSVKECGGFTTVVTTTENGADLSLRTGAGEIVAGDDYAQLYLIVNNNENKDLRGMLSFTPLGEWADSLSGQPINLHTGENNLYFTVNLREVKEGMNSATVSIRPAKMGEFEEKQFTLNFDVKKSSEGINGNGGVLSGNLDFFKGKSTTFWVVTDVILVIIGLFFIKAVFLRK